METDQVHVAELCAVLYDGFHHNEQDTDVRIECEGQKFLCHRAVLAAGSAYFEGMFNNNVWAESVTGSVFLAGDDMKAATLLEVLKYLYTGDTTITSSNFIDLLHACNYLGVPGLEALCVRIMLQNRPEPIVDLLEVLFFAHSFCNQSLINVLASCNMTERFKKFFETEEFLDINKDLFLTIVKLWKSPPIMNMVLRRAIYCWKVHVLDEREQREQDALELYEVLEPASETSLDHSIGPSHSLLQTSSYVHKTVAATPNPCLYVYTTDRYHRMKMYRHNGMNLRYKKFSLEKGFSQDSKIRDPRFVSVDNVGVFSMGHELGIGFYPSFAQFASANISGFEHQLSLACPPVDLWHMFDICNLSNRGLYLLLRQHLGYCPPVRNPIYDESRQEFSDDELQRGIYYYNIELDRWYPVPAMISHPCESCMTVQDNNVVYVISSHEDRKMVQAYDHRERQWHRKPSVLNIHTDPQSCVLDGSIYVRSAGYCERYDPIAGRWQEIRGFRIYDHEVQRLISYNNKLWSFRKRDFHSFYAYDVCFWHHLYHFIDVYDPRTFSWTFIRGVVDFKTEHLRLYETVVDAVVW